MNGSFLILAALPAIALCSDIVFDIPAVPVSLNLAGQAVSIALSGRVTGPDAKSGDPGQSFRLSLHADLADFQNHLTPLLQAELDKSDRCGERISIEDAKLAPAEPAAHLTVRLHVEKWVCIKAFGKENPKRLLGGNGVVEMTLTPHVDDTAIVRLDADVGRIDADGSLGEMLRSGSMGDALRDKIRRSLLKSVQKATDLSGVLPEQARQFAAIRSLAFADGGEGRLALNLDGKLQIPDRQLSSAMEQFRSRK
jgi:hypothetical protein